MRYLVILLVLAGFAIPQVFGAEELIHGYSKFELLPSEIVSGKSTSFEIRFMYYDHSYNIESLHPIIEVNPKSASPNVHIDVEHLEVYPGQVFRIPVNMTVDSELKHGKIFLNLSFVGNDSRTDTVYKSDWIESAIIDIVTQHGGITLDRTVVPVPFSYPPPLKFGIDTAIDEIKCNRDRVLILKHDGNPTCVFLETYSKLVQRGWAKYDSSFLDSNRQEILDNIRNTQNISGIAKEFLVSEALHEKIISGMVSDVAYDVNCCSSNLDNPDSITIMFHSDQKQMIVTAQYDLKHEKITCIETNPIINGMKVAFAKNPQEPQKQKESFTTIKPNTMQFFYYPDSAETKDKYKLFMLIRLPEWMGGAENNTSAFRAYSAKSLDDPCVVKYWADEGHQRIENPCQGGMYRVTDGALTYGAIYRSTAMTALPYLDLSMDYAGMLHVEPPKFTKDENGVVGYGRQMTLAELRDGSEFLVDSFTKHYPEYPKIPVEFAGYLLSEITPEKYLTTVRYMDFQSKSGYITMTISKQGFNSSINLAEKNKEFWQIGNTVIKVSYSESPYQRYDVIQFQKGNYRFAIEGNDVEFIKQEIVRNYFPEHSYDEMFLVSSTRE